MTHTRFSTWFILLCLFTGSALAVPQALAAPSDNGVLTDSQYQQAHDAIEKLKQNINAASAANRPKAVQALIDKLQKLIQKAPNDPHKPIWQTTLAQILLMNVLTGEHNRAIDFGQFGVTSASQEQALDRYSIQALEATNDASSAIFKLRGELAAGNAPASLTPDLRATLIDDYAGQRLPYFAGLAGIAVASQADRSPYFANLGKPKGVHFPHQKSHPKAERMRLGVTAAAGLQSVAQSAASPTLQYQSLILLGRAEIIAHHGVKAQKAVDQVLAANPTGYMKVQAQLTKAFALHLRGNDSQAISLLDKVSKENGVVNNGLVALLVTDAKFRILIDSAGNNASAINKAYAVYHKFLEEPWLGEKKAQAFQQYIARRWIFHLAGEKPNNLPPAVRLGIGRLERIIGQSEVAKAKGNMTPQAKQHYQNALAFLKTLTGKSVPKDVRAVGMYNLAITKFLMDQHSAHNVFSVVDILTEVAAQMPDQPIAEKSINTAVGITYNLLLKKSHPKGTKNEYVKAVTILFDKFPLSDTAANQRLYYAENILAPAGNYQKALEMVNKIPVDNSNYFYAQSDRLDWMKHQIDHASGSSAPTLRQLNKAAESVQKKAENALKTAKGEVAKAAKYAEAQAVLMQAESAAGQNDPRKALKLIENFKTRFPDEHDLIVEAQRQRLLFLIADSRIDEAGNAAKQMIQTNPAEGVDIVNGMLNDLVSKVDQLRARARVNPQATDRQKWLNQAQRYAKTASELAKLMYRWASEHHKTGKDLLPYQLMLARSELAAGNWDEAIKQLKPLHKKYPKHADIIQYLADALFQKGDEKSLNQAAKYYKRLIGGLSESHPPLFWHAWVQLLRIDQRLGKHTDQIALQVKILHNLDPNLGGEPYKQELLSLQRQYQ